jgi:tRNA G18 (ribose-2'-O)-methylase SpoU
MISVVHEASDTRLDAFRWRDRQLASKADRLESVGAGLFVAEGDLVVGRAIDAGCIAIALLCDESMAQHFSTRVPDSVDIFIGHEQLRQDVTGLGVPLRATGLFQRPPLTSPDELVSRSHRILVAEAVDNPTNLGAITRSAAALGWDALILTAGSADPLARRALRVSMGSGLTLPFARLDTTDSIGALLNRHECVSYGLTPSPVAVDIATVRPTAPRIALLLGSERDGLDENTMQSVHTLVRIPMHAGVDSLNVGVAAALAMYALGPTVA